MATTTRTHRSREAWDALVREILPELQENPDATIENFRSRIGSNIEAAKIALARQGFDPTGKAVPFKEITASTPAVLAKRVAARRRDGVPWWRIQAETGKTYAALTSLLPKHGYTLDGESSPNGSGPEA